MHIFLKILKEEILLGKGLEVLFILKLKHFNLAINGIPYPKFFK